MSRTPIDSAERARRMPSLIAAPFLSLEDAALYLNLPLSTLDKLRYQGEGPRCFKMSRRLYMTKDDLHAWVREKAKTAA